MQRLATILALLSIALGAATFVPVSSAQSFPMPPTGQCQSSRSSSYIRLAASSFRADGGCAADFSFDAPTQVYVWSATSLLREGDTSAWKLYAETNLPQFNALVPPSFSANDFTGQHQAVTLQPGQSVHVVLRPDVSQEGWNIGVSRFSGEVVLYIRPVPPTPTVNPTSQSLDFACIDYTIQSDAAGGTTINTGSSAIGIVYLVSKTNSSAYVRVYQGGFEVVNFFQFSDVGTYFVPPPDTTKYGMNVGGVAGQTAVVRVCLKKTTQVTQNAICATYADIPDDWQGYLEISLPFGSLGSVKFNSEEAELRLRVASSYPGFPTGSVLPGQIKYVDPGFSSVRLSYAFYNNPFVAHAASAEVCITEATPIPTATVAPFPTNTPFIAFTASPLPATQTATPTGSATPTSTGSATPTPTGSVTATATPTVATVTPVPTYAGDCSPTVANSGRDLQCTQVALEQTIAAPQPTNLYPTSLPAVTPDAAGPMATAIELSASKEPFITFHRWSQFSTDFRNSLQQAQSVTADCHAVAADMPGGSGGWSIPASVVGDGFCAVVDMTTTARGWLRLLATFSITWMLFMYIRSTMRRMGDV